MSPRGGGDPDAVDRYPLTAARVHALLASGGRPITA
jgi:hypothetical protein